MARGAGQDIFQGDSDGESERIDATLSASAMALLARLERESRDRRAALLRRRLERQAAFAAGIRPAFLANTRKLRAGAWQVAHPVERSAPTIDLWLPPRAAAAARPPAEVDALVVDVTEAPLTSAERSFPLEQRRLRMRAFDRHESRLVLDGRPVAAALHDFAIELSARAAARTPFAPLTCLLPPLENHLEARLWNDLLRLASEQLALPAGALRAVIVVDTLPALFELDEMLFELRPHATALLLDRVELATSTLERFGDDPTQLAPDLDLLLGAQPAAAAAERLVVATARRRGVRALLGPLRPAPSLRATSASHALESLCASFDAAVVVGFDGVAVADEALVELAWRRFVRATRPESRHGEDDPTSPALEEALLAPPRGERNGIALEANLNALVCFEAAHGAGAERVECDGRVEGRSSAALRRALLRQWLRHRAHLADGRIVTPELVRDLLAATTAAWIALPPAGIAAKRLEAAATHLAEQLALPK